MNQKISFTVESSGERLDRLLQNHLDTLSRTQIQAFIKDGLVQVDGSPVKAGVKLKAGALIEITLPESSEQSIQAEAIALDVVQETPEFVVINKAAGMVVHPGVGNSQGTLVHALLARYPELELMAEAPEAEGRMGIVHRLDKDTSGLLVIARTLPALRTLMAQFQARSVKKVYIAFLERSPKTATGVVDAPISRDTRQRKRMSVQTGGKAAITNFSIMDEAFQEGRTLVRLEPETGRTHQLRVHMAFIGCPIVGDRVYGFRRQRVSLKRHFLHAAELSFDHPETGERLHFSAPLPPDLQNLLDKLHEVQPD